MANKRISDGDSNPKSKYFRLYSIWSGMKNRCSSKTSNDYGNYGARGIVVCDEWKTSYKSFKEWSIKNNYNQRRTLDRINTNGNYEPLNCRWATNRTQANNKRSNVLIKVDGEELTLAELGRKYKINQATIKGRYSKWGKNLEKLIAPIGEENNKRIGIYIEYKGEEMSIVTLAKKLGINRKTLIRKYQENNNDINKTLLGWGD